MSRQPIQPLAPVEYEALLSHCSGCRSCRTAPERECPQASPLLREWSTAQRAERGARHGR
ncbi:hypothetical protein ACFW9X_03090 [Streptomyces sp. NPDC059466]|uniref:hypothetical protein n=1 Tax=Streptomyces sp. NPDC059466 TaxID=3346843 RepID=UPI003682385A